MASISTTDKENSQYRWVILGLVSCAFLFTFVTRFTWPPLIPVVVPVLGMSMSQAGAFMSAFYFGYIITQIPAGVLADKFGVRAILGASLIIEGIASFYMGSITSYDAGFTLRVITGLGAGAVMASCARAIMDWFPARERGIAFGVMLAAPSAGIVLSNFIVPALNNSVGWQGAFKTVGIFTAIVGILVFFLIRTSNEPQESKGIFSGFKVFFTDKNLVLTALAGFSLMWLALGTATWANAHVKGLGYSVTDAGLVMIFYGIGGAIAPIISGYISDVIGQRKSIIIVAYAMVIPVTITFGYMTSLNSLYVMGFIFGFVSYIANPQLTALVSELAGRENAGTANGIANFIFQTASLIGPVVLGFSIDITGTTSSVWWIMAAGPLVGILLMLLVKPNLAHNSSTTKVKQATATAK